ncbi:Uncharacterized protein HZ326_8465 [Fusarium oxysporum f. sp. albedinis]|nr:Uncharacterized protein HZ326_8465 [Fusarium oxysporum f. sp. albedinis]
MHKKWSTSNSTEESNQLAKRGRPNAHANLHQPSFIRILRLFGWTDQFSQPQPEYLWAIYSGLVAVQ